MLLSDWNRGAASIMNSRILSASSRKSEATATAFFPWAAEKLGASAFSGGLVPLGVLLDIKHAHRYRELSQATDPQNLNETCSE